MIFFNPIEGQLSILLDLDKEYLLCKFVNKYTINKREVRLHWNIDCLSGAKYCDLTVIRKIFRSLITEIYLGGLTLEIYINGALKLFKSC